MSTRSVAQVQNVRVSYGPRGRGLELAVVGEPSTAVPDPRDQDPVDGVLRIGDGCVTLELPAEDGRVSTLVWDPAEVDFADVGLAAG